MKPLHLLVLIGSTSYLTHEATRFTVSLYAIKLQTSPAIIGTLGAMFALLPALTSLAIGRWIDQIGARRPMLICAVMMIIGCAVPFFWESVAALFITSVIVGTFYNAFFIASSRLLAQLGRPGQHVKNIGASSTGFSTAILLAPLLAGFVIDAWGHANALLMLSMLPLLPCAVIGFGWLRIPDRAPRTDRTAATPSASIVSVVRSGRLRQVFIATVGSQVAWSLYVFLMPLYGSQIGMSASRIGVVMGGFSLMTVLIRSTLPVFVHRLTVWQVLLLALTGASVCLAAFPFFTGFAALMGLGILLGVCLGLSGPMALTLLYESAPPERLGEALGLRITLMNTSFTVVPFLSGTIAATIGLAPVFWLLAGVLVASSLATRRRWHDPRQLKS